MGLPDVDALIAFHDVQLDSAAGQIVLPASGELMDAIADNHRCNLLLWRTEDEARRNDVPAEAIVRSKRSIDRYNQQRNDAVERIDDALLALLAQLSQTSGMMRRPDARQHSETAGAMIDRLSILSLKIFHMRLQARRTDADTAHRADCGAKLHRLLHQRQNLRDCLARLLEEIRRGEAHFEHYHQFKMYNDPRLNPWLTTGDPAPPPDASTRSPPQ